MGSLTLLVFLLLAAAAMAKDSPAPAPAPRPAPPPPPPDLTPLTPAAPAIIPAAYTPPPWPQATPSGLPPFPSGWTPDEPPGPGVVSRAWALLSQLWKYGAGTKKTEQTSGRWITYVATPMGSKKGVVAYRLKDQGSAPSGNTFTQA